VYHDKKYNGGGKDVLLQFIYITPTTQPRRYKSSELGWEHLGSTEGMKTMIAAK
jgi:hypothetical protein